MKASLNAKAHKLERGAELCLCSLGYWAVTTSSTRPVLNIRLDWKENNPFYGNTRLSPFLLFSMAIPFSRTRNRVTACCTWVADPFPVFNFCTSCQPKINTIPQPYMCNSLVRTEAGQAPAVLLLAHSARYTVLFCWEHRFLSAMHITQLNRECLLHLFSFLDKSSRKSLGQTCQRLLEVFQDPSLWSLLSFHSPVELKKDNFLLGAALKYLSICWHSSRVKVCNIEDWMKSSFQKDICSKHENTVNEFLLQVCNRYVLQLACKLGFTRLNTNSSPCRALHMQMVLTLEQGYVVTCENPQL